MPFERDLEQNIEIRERSEDRELCKSIERPEIVTLHVTDEVYDALTSLFCQIEKDEKEIESAVPKPQKKKKVSNATDSGKKVAKKSKKNHTKSHKAAVEKV